MNVTVEEPAARPAALPVRRTRILATMMALAFALLAGRLVQLQGIDRRELGRRANRQRSYVETVPARPGDILDRRGRLLATTVSTRSLYVVPSRIEHPAEMAHRLAAALAVDEENLLDSIRRHREKDFLWVQRRLRDEKVERIRSLDLPPGTWGFRREYRRRYPQGRLAVHVLGLRDIDGIGRGGIEGKFDRRIHGRDGQRLLIRDARGRVIDVHSDRDRAPRHGQTVVLTLDAVVQLYAERELDRLVTEWKPRTACAIVLDPRTCQLLAVASRPAFDPNRPGEAALGSPALSNSRAATAWKNTAVAAMYEPGSTFKPFVAAWAVDRGVVSTDEIIDCENGRYRMGGRLLHDIHPHGRLSITDVLVKSSNIGMAKIGERLGNRQLYNAARAFGFGSRTGSGLPGEIDGLLRPLEQWNDYSTGSVPMGQELAVTPLQLIVAHAALANGGRLMSPRLVLRVEGPGAGFDSSAGAAEPSSTVVSRAIGEQAARWMVQGPLREVVRRGTGTRAQIEGYSVFGKSGTAQKFDPELGRYSSHRDVSSFLCGAPAESPRLLVLVLADEPSVGKTHFGGTVAAPAARRILEQTLRYLGIPPGETRLQSAERP